MALCYIWAGLLSELFKPKITVGWVFVLTKNHIHWLFLPYFIGFIPSSHHFPLQSIQGIWVKFPSSVSGKRPVVFSLKPGDGSSISFLHFQDRFPPSVGQNLTLAFCWWGISICLKLTIICQLWLLIKVRDFQSHPYWSPVHYSTHECLVRSLKLFGNSENRLRSF